MNAPYPLITELRDHLKRLINRCQSMQWLGCAVHVEIASDIAEEASQHQELVSQRAYTAEAEDLEADRCLSAAMDDGKLTESDLPLIERALKHVRRSAKIDREVCDALSIKT